jgi:hypothetical protein
MTIEEMHIAVNLGVQKIASFQVDNLLPQEIDHELNDAMFAFIKQRYSPMGNKYRDGFEQSQKRIDDLRALVVDARVKCFYYGETITGFFTDRAPLPNDYMFLVNAFSDGYCKCDGVISYVISSINYRVNNISMTPPAAQEGWNMTNITVGGTSIISNADGLSLEYLLDINNYDSALSANIAPAMSNPDFAAEVATTLTGYSLDTLAASELTPTSDSNTLTLLLTGALLSGEIVVTWSDPLGAADDVEVSYTQPTATTVQFRAYNNTGTRQREMMSYVQHDDLYKLMGDPFNSPTCDRIKYTIQENFIDVHSDASFFTTFVDVKYIRQPQLMDNALGVGCELAPHTHQEIVEMAVQSILEAISDPRYNSQSREVLESE